MRVVDLEQRSPDWLLWRAAGVGSSDAAALLGASPWKTRDELKAEKVLALRGVKPADVQNSAMARGRRLEGVIAAWYEGWYGPSPACCAVHSRYPFLKASFDGYSGAEKIVSEYKAPNWQDHEEALAGRIPAKYLPQVNHLLLVAGEHAEGLRYVSMGSEQRFGANRRYAVVFVKPDKAALDDLMAAELAFWAEVLEAAG